MNELRDVKALAQPNEILLVVDAMIGQEAANVAREFNAQLEVTGVILTKIDGDTRGGAALSVRHITGKPINLGKDDPSHFQLSIKLTRNIGRFLTNHGINHEENFVWLS